MTNIKKLVLVLGILASTSSFADGVYRVVTTKTCTDQSRVNNAGTIQVKVLADIYEGSGTDAGLTFLVTGDSFLYLQKNPTGSNEEMGKGKPRKIELEAAAGSGSFSATAKLIPLKDGDFTVQIAKVTANWEYSDDSESMPKNYDPTYLCR